MNPNFDFLSESNNESNKEKYKEYYELTDYQRKCLVATNYWRVMNGMSFIEVPEEDKHFHQYFDKRCFQIYEDKKKRETNLKLNAKSF